MMPLYFFAVFCVYTTVSIIIVRGVKMQLTITMGGTAEGSIQTSFQTELFNEGLACSVFKECIGLVTSKKMEFSQSIGNSVSVAIKNERQLEESTTKPDKKIESKVPSKSKRIVHYKCASCNTERYAVTSENSITCFVCNRTTEIDEKTLVPLKLTCSCGEFTHRQVVMGSTTKIKCRKCKKDIRIKHDIWHHTYEEDFK